MNPRVILLGTVLIGSLFETARGTSCSSTADCETCNLSQQCDKGCDKSTNPGRCYCTCAPAICDKSKTNAGCPTSTNVYTGICSSRSSATGYCYLKFANKEQCFYTKKPIPCLAVVENRKVSYFKSFYYQTCSTANDCTSFTHCSVYGSNCRPTCENFSDGKQACACRCTL